MKNKNILKIILIILLSLSLSACNKKIAKIFPERPNNELAQDPAKDKNATPEFRQGWADGCEAGMGSSGNTFYQMFYDNNKADGYKMMASGDYRTAWSAAFWYCLRYNYVKANSSMWGSTFSGYR